MWCQHDLTEGIYTIVVLGYNVSMELKSDIFLGDAAEILQSIDENSVDLVVASPPYADQRKNTYGGIPSDKYVEWFLHMDLTSWFIKLFIREYDTGMDKAS
jgi:DNA modification methylase